MNKKILYRYEGYDTYSLTHPWELEILRETKCGYWIVDHDKYPTGEKWVSKTGRKRYAYPTAKEAMVNYIARKNRQIKYLNRMLALANKGLYITTGRSNVPVVNFLT